MKNLDCIKGLIFIYLTVKKMKIYRFMYFKYIFFFFFENIDKEITNQKTNKFVPKLISDIKRSEIFINYSQYLLSKIVRFGVIFCLINNNTDTPTRKNWKILLLFVGQSRVRWNVFLNFFFCWKNLKISLWAE